MTIEHTEESTRRTKGLRTFLTLLGNPAGKGITKVIDNDGSIFELVAPPITDSEALKQHKKKAAVDLMKVMGKAALHSTAISVLGAATPYLVSSAVRSVENIRFLVMGKPHHDESVNAKRSLYRVGGAKTKAKLIAGEIRDAFVPEQDEVELGLELLKGSLAYTGTLISVLSILGLALTRKMDGSRWEAIDVSGKRVPL